MFQGQGLPEVWWNWKLSKSFFIFATLERLWCTLPLLLNPLINLLEKRFDCNFSQSSVLKTMAPKLCNCVRNGSRKNGVRLVKNTKNVPDLDKGRMEGRLQALVNLYRRLFASLIFIVCQTLSGCVKSLINYSAYCSINSFFPYFPASGEDTKNVQSVICHTLLRFYKWIEPRCWLDGKVNLQMRPMNGLKRVSRVGSGSRRVSLSDFKISEKEKKRF